MHEGSLKTYDMPLLLETEKIRLPSGTPPPSDGDCNFLVTQEDIGEMIFFFPKMILHVPPPFW
jgi:hypothetical protein